MRKRFVTENKARFEKETYNALIGALNSNDIPQCYYAINKYSEEAVCIEKEKNSWSVYLGERGQKNNIKSFTCLNTACLEMIEQLTESYEQEEKIKEDFKKNCKIFSSVLPTATMKRIGIRSVRAFPNTSTLVLGQKRILGSAAYRKKTSTLAAKQSQTKKPRPKTVRRRYLV